MAELTINNIDDETLYASSQGGPYQCDHPPTKEQKTQIHSLMRGPGKARYKSALQSFLKGAEERLSDETMDIRRTEIKESFLAEFRRINTEATATGQKPSLSNTAQCPPMDKSGASVANTVQEISPPNTKQNPSIDRMPSNFTFGGEALN
jgi:hypothetical protein